jgi:hypothetical protein
MFSRIKIEQYLEWKYCISEHVNKLSAEFLGTVLKTQWINHLELRSEIVLNRNSLT